MGIRDPQTWPELAAKWFVLYCRALAITGLVWFVIEAFDLRPHDATDPVDGRSGMELLRDAGTGCEYLAAPVGGLSPRMSSTGEHMGCRP